MEIHNAWGQIVRTAGAIVLPFFLLGPVRLAQSQQGEDVNKGLSAPVRAVTARLESLNRLPAADWRYHSGDLPHGELPDLDDSAWPVAQEPSDYSGEAVWFRKWVEVPQTLHGYDLTGVRIWFQFHAGANGPMPQIVYFNGRRVALGDDLEPIVLFDRAKPGEKVLIAVKLLHTVDKKRFSGTELKIDFAEGRPDPEDLRTEILTAATLIPSVSQEPASGLAILDRVAGAVDLHSLDAADQTKFDASLKQAQTELEALKPTLRQVTMHLTGNSHIDAAWLWPWTETVDVVKRTFGTALQLMNEYPDYTYTQSAAQYNEWIADKYPEMNAQIKQRIKEGRWEIVGGMWVEPDLNMPDGESLVRQLLVGKRWFQQNYGVDVRIGWNPDSFGYTWQLPQIYKRSGIDYFVTQKTAWNDTNQFPFKLFWWESPDGSRVLSYFPHDYGNNNLNPVRLSRDFALARERTPGLTEMMDLYGIGDHGGGPTRAVLDEGEHWMQPDKLVPHMQYGTAQSYFNEFEKKIVPESRVWDYYSIAKGYELPSAPPAGKVAIPTWKSELYFEYHRGVMTTQANHKRNMRDSEVEVLNAEKWASLAWLEGKAYPGEELTEDWKKVLFNQFHDLAAGSGIGVIYKDAQKDYDVVRYSTNEMDAEAFGVMTEKINTAGSKKAKSPQSIVVFNSLGWQRSGNVTVRLQVPFSKTARVAFADASKPDDFFYPKRRKSVGDDVEEVTFSADDVPALGYRVYRLLLNEEFGIADNFHLLPKESSGIISISNSDLSLAVDKQSGCVTELIDERTKYDSIKEGTCGNQLQFFKDTPKDYDAWNVDPGTFDVAPTVIEKADSVESIGRDAIRIMRHWQNSKFVQTIRLEGDQVDIDNDIDWHESHVLLKAAFPLAASGPFATYEIPYGTIDRPTTRNNSWEKAQFEVPAMRWADLGDGKHGLSVLNQTKYGYDAVGNLLRLTLLRSPKWPDPEADMGHHHFHYALYPHVGTWKDALTVRHGYEYNYPLTAVVTTAHPGSLPAEHSFASVEPENVVLTALKKAEDANGLIFRVYEWAGKASDVRIHLPKGATGATVTNLMEKPEGSTLPVSNDTVTVPIHPYEILTVRVDYPATK